MRCNRRENAALKVHAIDGTGILASFKMHGAQRARSSLIGTL
jgi:hypothetical protein